MLMQVYNSTLTILKNRSRLNVQKYMFIVVYIWSFEFPYFKILRINYFKLC